MLDPVYQNVLLIINEYIINVIRIDAYIDRLVDAIIMTHWNVFMHYVIYNRLQTELSHDDSC